MMISQKSEDDTLVFNNLLAKRENYQHIEQNLTSQHLSLQVELKTYQAIHSFLGSLPFQQQISDIVTSGQELSGYLIKKYEGERTTTMQSNTAQYDMTSGELQDRINEIEYQIQLQNIREERIAKQWNTFKNYLLNLQGIKLGITDSVRTRVENNREKIDKESSLKRQILRIIQESSSLNKEEENINLIKDDDFEVYIYQENHAIIELTQHIDNLRVELIPLLTTYDECKVRDALKAIEFNKYEELTQIKTIQHLQQAESSINQQLHQLQKELNVASLLYEFTLTNQPQNIQKEARSQMKRYNTEKRSYLKQTRVKIDNFLKLISNSEDESIRSELQDILNKYKEIKNQEQEL